MKWKRRTKNDIEINLIKKSNQILFQIAAMLLRNLFNANYELRLNFSAENDFFP